MNPHPSYLRLDRLALGAHDRDAREHVETCHACRTHVLSVAPAGAERVHEVRVRRLRAGRRFLAVAGAVTALAAGIAIAFLRPEAYVGAKGDPAVAVHVKRGDLSFLWNGAVPLVPGDVVRVEVSPEGRRYLAVVGGDPPAPLWSGALSGHEDFLVPGAFALDGSPGPEVITIALTDAPLTADEIRALPAAPRGAWVTRLSIPKAAP